MKRAAVILVIAARLLCRPEAASAASTVFAGDPVNPVTSQPYEILPGFPLIEPGPDGLLGTADDRIDDSKHGDVDLVVRSGSIDAVGSIPPPALQSGRGALPQGISGADAAGGREIPFTVFLSDGLVTPGAPAGNVLAAADMNGLPVVVAAFADWDGDGFIGPTNLDRAGDRDDHLEVRELEPVGRAAALFSGGVAHGSIAVQAGLPTSRGGLEVALAAIALTGPFDPNFFEGNIPSGPAIATALPFLPQRALDRLIRDRAVPAGPNTTLQAVIRFASLPSPADGISFALPLDGSSVTIDGALVQSQPVVGAALVQPIGTRGRREAVTDLTIGTRSPSNVMRLRLVPVDRLGNPSDPPPGFAVTIVSTPPLAVKRPRDSTVKLTSPHGLAVNLRTAPGSTSASTGTVTAERDGAVIAAAAYHIDPSANGPRFDLSVPSREAPTIQQAIDTVADRNRDGALVIGIRPGWFHENLVVNRPVMLWGRDAATTIVQGNSLTPVLQLTAPNAVVRGLTAIGGASGCTITGSGGRLIRSRAWDNVGHGIVVTAANADIEQTTSQDNGGDGLAITAGAGAVCANSRLLDNDGTGASLSSAQSGELSDNDISGNATGGVTIAGGTDGTVTTNRLVLNFGAGIAIAEAEGVVVSGNLSTLNDDDGLRMDRAGGAIVLDNNFDSNHGYGMFVRRSPDADFSAVPGVQNPPGDNQASGNRKGDVFVRQD